MRSLLESLYYGSLIPDERVVSKDPKYRALSRQISESMESWKKKLSEDDFKDLEALADLFHQVQGMDMAASFTCGFKLGAAMMIEVLA
ncbi:DUF6809 family protein [Paenibacillus zanthoxyli]|uniref:DUF6809 family protein n=1 Tax=Paenibacillus zanthoxyli TaxID=369399 RepID=UPI000472C001|nr:DUF6809 family protein [Paenibacillus zanthoxyli]